MPDILFFSEVKEEDLSLIGEKAKKLSMLSKAGFKIPPGFIITKGAMDKLLSRRDIQNKIAELFRPNADFKSRSEELQRSIKSIEFPEELADEIIDAYLSLSVSIDKPTAASLLDSVEAFVAVRNSTFVNHHNQKTILNIKGKDLLFRSILDSYAENFSHETISKNRQEDIASAIIVQRMVDAEKSGSAFANNSDLIITACFGLGEGLESGYVFPDTYVIDKDSLGLKGIKVGEKNYAYTRDLETDATIKQELGEKSRQQVIDEKEIAEIVNVLKKATNFFGKEQKIEWSVRKEILYILQSKDNANSQPERVQFDISENLDEKDGPIVDATIEKIDIIQEDNEDFILQSIDEKKPGVETSESLEWLEIIHLDSLSQSKAKMERNSSYDKPEEIVIRQEENKDMENSDDSFFPGYEEAKEEPKEKGVNRIAELARMNAGNTVVYCHLAARERLRQRLSRYTKDCPDDFSDMIDSLLRFETVPNELKLRKLDKSAKNFMVNLKYPEPEDVEIGLRMLEG